MKTFFELRERRLLPRYFDTPGKGKGTIKIKWVASDMGIDSDLKRFSSFFNIKLKKSGRDQVVATGDKHDLIYMLQHDDYGMEYDEIKKQFPGLFK